MTISEAILTLNANVVFACGRAGFDSATIKMVEDALDIIEDALQAQEPVEPDIEGNVEYDGHGSWWHVCGACRQPIDKGDKFCRWCGKAVKWK